MRLFGLFLLLATSLVAQTTEELFLDASTHYENSDFDPALTVFQAIENTPIYSSDLYFNIANCYYKTNNIAKAVLYYEKALKLAPKDEDVLFNLKLVQLQLVDRLAVVPLPFYTKWMDTIENLFEIDQWAKIGVVYFLTFCIFLLYFLFSSNYKLKRKLFLFSILSLLASLLIFGIASHSLSTEKPYAILMEMNAYVKSAPSMQSEDLFILHEGAKVEVLEIFKDWTKIKLSDGMIGWLKTADLERI